MRKTLLIVCFCLTFIFVYAQTTPPKASQAKKTSVAPAKRPSSTKTTTPQKPVRKPTTVSAPAKPIESTTAPVSEAPSSTAVQTSQVQEAQPVTQSSAPVKSTSTHSSAAKPATPTRRASYNGKGFFVGLRGGANMMLNKIEFVDLTGQKLEMKRTPGFAAGLVLNYGFGSVFSIQPEILYTRRSLKLGADIAGQAVSVKTDLNLLEVPLLLKLSVGGNVRFFVNAGPYITYALDGKNQYTIGGETKEEKIKFDKGDARLEYGATGGFGVSIPAGRGAFLLEGRYTYGLGTDAKNQPDDYVGPEVATVSMTYLFRLGR